MTVLGIVAEYNPLHKGHAYHLATARRETGAEVVVIALSGNFVQRGEPALVDKWHRTRMALAAGADLVVEIPCYHVLQSAEGFARSGVALLAACGITHLSFGSEAGTVAPLVKLAQWLDTEDCQERINANMARGSEYAAAVEQSVRENKDMAALAPLLARANNILGIEYIRALNRSARHVQIHTVKRLGAGHRSLESSPYASATAIRLAVANQNWQFVRSQVPESTWTVCKQALVENKPAFLTTFDSMLRYALARATAQQLKKLPAASEGLENRLKSCLAKGTDVNQLLARAKTKRYPLTRLQRLLFQALLEFDAIKPPPPAPYIRVLGCSVQGQRQLSAIARLGSAPLVVSGRDVESLAPSARVALELDWFAAQVYSIAVGAAAVADYKRPLIKGV